jgi:hypothetical protein
MEERTLELFIKHLALGLFSDLDVKEQRIFASSFKDLMGEAAGTTIVKSKELFSVLHQNFQNVRSNPLFPKFQENETYQKALQKLDVEIRNHLKQELQMKLYLDDVKEKVKNFSFIETYNQERLEFLNVSNERLVQSIHLKECEIENLKFSDSKSDELEAKLLADDVKNEEESIRKMKKNLENVEKMLEKKKNELNVMENEYFELQEIFCRLKALANAYDEKNAGVVQSVREEKNENRQSRAKVYRQANVISPICLNDEKILKISRLSQSTKRIRNTTSKNLKENVIRSRTKIRLQMYAVK